MKRALWLVLWCGVAITAHAQCVAVPMVSAGEKPGAGESADPKPVVTAQVEKFTVDSVASDRIQLAVHLAWTSSRDAKVRSIAFENLRGNGLQFYAPPLNEELVVTAGKRTSFSHPVQATIYYRDLDNLRPLQQLITEQRVHIEGTAYLEVELSTLQKVLTLHSHVRVPVRFQQDVPVELAGGPTMRAAALKVLALAAIAMDHLQSKVEAARTWTSKDRQQLWHDYAPAMLLVSVRFSLHAKDGAALPFECTGAGFRISAERFVVAKQLIEPWKFDPEMAAAIQHHGASIDYDDYDIRVWPAYAKLDPGLAFRQKENQIRLVSEPKDELNSAWVPEPEGKMQKVSLHQTEGTANLALFEFLTPAGIASAYTAKQDLEVPGKPWDRLALFRFPAGDTGQEARPDLIFLSATSSGQSIRLGTPVDSSAWGAPLIGPNGIVGLIQNENTALMLGDVLRALNAKP